MRGVVSVQPAPTIHNSVLITSFIISCVMTYWFMRLLFMGTYGDTACVCTLPHVAAGFGALWAFVFQPPKNDPSRWRN